MFTNSWTVQSRFSVQAITHCLEESGGSLPTTIIHRVVLYLFFMAFCILNSNYLPPIQAYSHCQCLQAENISTWSRNNTTSASLSFCFQVLAEQTMHVSSLKCISNISLACDLARAGIIRYGALKVDRRRQSGSFLLTVQKSKGPEHILSAQV